MQQDNTPPETRLIKARSQKQVMDWSLVLASQNIPAEIIHNDGDWALAVDGRQFDRAQEVIRL